MNLVDDLLEVAPDQWLEQLGKTPVEPDAIEHRLVVGRPLDQPHTRLAVRPTRDIVEEVAVAEAVLVSDTLGVKLIRRGRDFGDLALVEEAANYRVPVAPIMREVGA